MFTKYNERRLDEVLMTTTRTYLEFSVRACHGAVVALSGEASGFDNAYYLVIGQDNTHTVLTQRNEDGGGFVAKVETHLTLESPLVMFMILCVA